MSQLKLKTMIEEKGNVFLCASSVQTAQRVFEHIHTHTHGLTEFCSNTL